jgi:hypothetical protein
MPARLLASALTHLGGLLTAQVRGWLRSARQASRRAWAARPSAARLGAILLALSLAGASATSLAALAGRPARLPSELDWRAAATLLQRDARPGDAVLLAPAWLERAREVVPPGLPLLARPQLADERLLGVRRAWLLTAPSAMPARRDLARDLAGRSRAWDTQHLGALEVTRYDLGVPVVPVARLADRPPPLAVVRQRDGGGSPRRCLELSPAPGAPVTLAFPATPLGRILAGHAALETGHEGPPVRIAFSVDEEEIGALTLAGAGWRSFELDTSRHGFTAHLVTVVASAEEPGAGPICLEALALP